VPEKTERERISRLLIAEDDSSQLFTLSAIMRKEGFDVVGCATASEALERIGREEFGMAIVDLHLPDLSGTQLLEKMRRLDREILVIINTAHGSFDSAKSAVNLGAFAYVEKAGDPEELVRSVHAASRWHLDRYAGELEEAVAERTSELREANDALKRELVERRRAEEEREKLAAELLQAQKMEAIGQLAGGVAHDFNNSLTGILGHLELSIDGLKSRLAADDPLLEGLEQAEQGALHSASLTRQLLAFSRRQVSNPVLLDLNETLIAMKKMLSPIIREDVELKFVLDPDLQCVFADASQIQQVIMNLVVNGQDAMPEGGRLMLETSNVALDEAYCSVHAEARPRQHVMLAVSDTGCGLTPEAVERIFEPFYTTKPEAQGTGLGLAMVYGIVKSADGDIEVCSEPGRGTTVRIHLPGVEEEAAESPSSRGAVLVSGGSETVLVCEDNDMVRRLAVRFLGSAGYTVLSAENGETALETAAAFDRPIHLLFSDVILPDTNGRRVADALSATRPDLRTLFVSGYPSDALSHRGVLDEGVEFLEKPFSRDGLLRRVREVLDS
jgi:signal transduction histidine kinase